MEIPEIEVLTSLVMVLKLFADIKDFRKFAMTNESTTVAFQRLHDFRSKV